MRLYMVAVAMAAVALANAARADSLRIEPNFNCDTVRSPDAQLICSSPALQEAQRPIEEHVALQHDLQKLSFLPPTATVDRVYGASVLAGQANRNDTVFVSSARTNSSGQAVGQLAFLRSWVGRYPDAAPDSSGNYTSLPPDKMLWANPVLRSALTTLLGKVEFEEMLSLDGPESTIEQHGSWLVWSKCKEHECPDWNYSVFINPDQNDIEVCYLRIEEEISGESVTLSSVIARWLSPNFRVPVHCCPVKK